MKLPFLSLFKKKAPTNYFLALLFRDEKIHAVVFEEVNNRIQVIGEGKAPLETSVDTTAEEALLDSCDKAISFAEEVLPEDIQTHKTVLGVKETWVEEAHIKKEYLAKLKKIGDQLDLQPIGFLIFPEAIAHLLQKEEGAPVSAILVESGKRHVSITLLRAGRIVGNQQTLIQESLTQTIEQALQQFHVEILPSRIILFDSGNAQLEKELLSHRWSKTLPFLHVPQITTLPSDFDTRAVLFGTATQMGFDAIDVVKKGAVIREIQEEPEKNVILSDNEESDTKNNDESGSRIESGMINTTEEVSGKDTSAYFGFVKDKDIAESAEGVQPTPFSEDESNTYTQELPEIEEEEAVAGEAPGFSMSGPIFIEGAKKAYRRIKRQFLPKQFSLKPLATFTATFLHKLPGKGNRLVTFLVIGFAAVVALFLWYFLGTTATIILLVNPKVISQDQQVTFTTTGATDPTQNLIAAQSISVDEEGKVSGSTTGTKDEGNPAKGTVTVFNSDDSSHTLSSGTTITSSNGLTFTLDKDVTVASASGDIFTGTQPGTTDVTVTASDIGTNYNLPSDTKFSIANTSVLAAKNANAFAGGTKQTVTVVSQKDADQLISQLTENLKDKAKTDLLAKVSSDEVILPDFTNTTPGVTNFDKKVGDAADSLTLDGTITYQTIFYKKTDIAGYAKASLDNQLPPNFSLAPNGITYSVKNMTTKDGTTHVTLTMHANLLPILDSATLTKQLAGKSFDSARDILSSTPGYQDSTFATSPFLFAFSKSLPRLSSHLTIHLVSHE